MIVVGQYTAGFTGLSHTSLLLHVPIKWEQEGSVASWDPIKDGTSECQTGLLAHKPRPRDSNTSFRFVSVCLSFNPSSTALVQIVNKKTKVCKSKIIQSQTLSHRVSLICQSFLLLFLLLSQLLFLSLHFPTTTQRHSKSVEIAQNSQKGLFPFHFSTLPLQSLLLLRD